MVRGELQHELPELPQEGESGGRASSEPSLEGHADMQGESRRPEGSDRSVMQRMLVEGIAHRTDTSTTGEAPDI